MRFRLSGTTIPLILLLYGAAPAQQSSSPPSQQAQSEAKGQPASEASAKKVKKVWTNDNLGVAKEDVSVVGGVGKASKITKDANKADTAYIQNARKQLERLQGQLADITKQMAALKQFSQGEGSGQADRQLHKGYNMQPIEQQMQALEAKHKDTQAQIDALLDEARKKGVQPGDLR